MDFLSIFFVELSQIFTNLQFKNIKYSPNCILKYYKKWSILTKLREIPNEQIHRIIKKEVDGSVEEKKRMLRMTRQEEEIKVK